MKNATICIGLIIVFFLSDCLLIGQEKNSASGEERHTVVIIGGKHSTPGQMSLLSNSFPGSVVIVPEASFPLWFAADSVLEQLKKKGVQGELVLIGHSWGGLIAREIDGGHPGLVRAVITIATPNGNFRLIPDIVSDFAFRPGDGNSTTPLFIIGGYSKACAEKKWWMTTEKSDGVVDIASIMATGPRNVAAATIFEGEHTELLRDAKVLGQIKTWFAHLPDRNGIKITANTTGPLSN